MRTFFLGLARTLGRAAFVVTALWLAAAAWYAGFTPAWVGPGLAALVLVGFPVAWFVVRRKRRVALVFVVVAAGAIVAWQFKRPSHDRAWSLGVDQPVVIALDGDTATLQQLRDFRYRGPDEIGARYYQRTLDLRTLRSVDFVVERFHALEGLAHTLLSFGFAGDTYVCVSIEIRREVGETFNPIAGLFKQYELMYVLGSEEDLIGLRTNHRKSEVWMFPIKTTRARMRALFVDMLDRAARLQVEPEFYNTLTSSCTTNIVDHVTALAPGRVPLDWRVYVPGYSGALAHELGLIDTTLSYDEAEEHFRIDEVAREGRVDEVNFSRRIRSRR